MTRERSAARTTFLRDTLSAAIEGGVQYWATVIEYDPDAATALIIDHEDDDADPQPITLDTIAHGWSLYRGETFQGREYGKQAMKANRTNGAEGDVDADVADNVLQLGLFDEIIYG